MSTDQTLAIGPWLEKLWDQGGSDLLLSGDSAPRIRVDGKLRPLEGAPVLTGNQIDEIALPLLTPGQLAIFRDQLDVDFAFSWLDRARIRGSIFTQRGQTALALRVIPARIPNFDDLGLPAAATWVSEQPRGFVLVTGPTGSGKSTTLASIIDKINETRAAHILTIEDPVEYVHHHKTSAVSQREIGLDSPSFDRALRSALREDPDVLLIGEMRDIDSIQIALTMAETGHLVFATLHTNDAPQAIDRIIDVFPAWRGHGRCLRSAHRHQPGAKPHPRRSVQPTRERDVHEHQGGDADLGVQPRDAHHRWSHHLRGRDECLRTPEGVDTHD